MFHQIQSNKVVINSDSMTQAENMANLNSIDLEMMAKRNKCLVQLGRSTKIVFTRAYLVKY